MEPNTRLLAIESLLKIFNEKATPKIALETLSSSLDKRDRAFLMEIVYGVLRFRDALDWILNHFLKNPKKLGDALLNNLRIAVYQLYFMRVPDFAVVHESVEIEKTGGKPSLVNAVLRNILRQKEKFNLPFSIKDPVMNIAVNTSHPKWLVKRWISRLGYDGALSLARANNEIPLMTIRANTLRITRDDLIIRLAGYGISSEPTLYSPDGIILKEVHSHADLSPVSGLFIIQDEASQLISYLLNPQPYEKILDACSAPGGKTTHIAQLMQDKGEITAIEQDPRRIKKLNENIDNLGLKSIRVIAADFNELANTGEFDRILLDAPCSAIGVIRKNPDIKYRHRAKDLQEYKSKQLKLLLTASDKLKKNGLLVYSVCSIEPEEGEDVINEFLKTKQDFRIIDSEKFFLHSFINRGFFRTYPHKDNMDGFFGVILCRTM